MRTLSSWHIIHRIDPFFFTLNIHTLLSEREGAQLTQMLHKLQFSLNRVCFVQAKKCTRTATEK